MNIFSTRKAEKVRKAFFSGFLIVSLILSQVALPISAAYATAGGEDSQTTTVQSSQSQHHDDDDDHKINICHASGNSGNWQALNVDQNGWGGHSTHSSDYLYAGPVTNQQKPTNAGNDWCKDHAPKPVDVCPNIDGNQSVVPEGKQLVGGNCVDIPKTATLEAKKIVCDTEADLPNWGAHNVTTTITATTAADFVAAHAAHCQIKPWTFEWAANSATNPGDNAQTGGSGWTTFTSTATVPTGSTLWVREQTQSGYVPFSGATTDLTSDSAKNSAEIYCDSDVLNYDNFDRTDTINANETHHCVAFNAKVAEPIQCIEGKNLIKNGDFEAPALPTNSWDVIKDKVLDPSSVLEWFVSWIVGSPLTVGARLGLEIQNHVAGNPALDGGQQFAELDGDSPVTISQTIPTVVGKQYSLTFKYSPRPTASEGSNTAADNSMVVKINGVVLGATIDGTATTDTNWTTITRTFIADSASTKIEITDTGSDNGTGGYIDNVSLTCNPEPIPQCKEDASSDYVSNNTVMVDSHAAVPVSTPVNGAWSANIPGATWIWSEADVLNATVDTTKTFDKTFTVVGTPKDSSLMIAADNNYDVKVNGVAVVGPGCSDITGATFGGAQTCTIPAAMMTTGTNTLSIIVKNWAVAGSDAKSNPAGLLFKLNLHNNECITPPPTPKTSTVTMCKTDDAQPAKPLPGWTLMLQGASVGSVDVLPNGADFKIAGVPAGDYILKALGQYTYRGTPGAEYSDAAYSKRDPSDAVYTAAAADVNQSGFLPWVRENNFPNPYEGYLGVMYNNASTNWGSIFNPTHEYALGTTTGSLGDMSFKILDNAYEDNSGKITVDALHGYTGVTGENGCVELKNVPYGTYTADEILKAGWSKVSGTGTVVVDQPTEHFTIVNHDTTVPVNGKVHIFKFINGAQATVEGADSVAFPMFTATYNAPFFLRPSGWANGDAPYEASTGDALVAGSTYTANEDLSASPALVGASCEADTHPAYKLVGYTTGSSLAEAQAKTPTLGTPAVTINGDQYIIVWNQKCGEVQGAHTLKVHLYKYLTNGDGPATQIPNDSSAPAFPMTATWKTANLNGGVSSSSPYVLGNYHGGVALKYAADTAPMEAPADYTSSEVTSTDSDFLPIGAQCVPGKYRLVGYKSSIDSLATAEGMPTISSIAPEFVNLNTDAYVIVINEKCADEIKEPVVTYHTTVVSPSDMHSWSFVVDNSAGSTGSLVIGPTTPPLQTGSANLTVTANNQGEYFGTPYAGTLLSDITTLKYSTYRVSGDAVVVPTIQFNIDPDTTDANTAWQGRLVYEPYYTQTTTTGVWQEWDALNDAAGTGTGNWWFSNGTVAANVGCTQADPCTWSELKTKAPHAGIHGTLGAIGVKAGSNWGSFTGSVDKFVIGVTSGLNTNVETYDFEPAAVTACSDGIDNDQDTFVDASDPGCHSDGNASNSESYVASDNDESNGGGSGPILPPGGGGNGSRMITGSSNGGQVLGASTQCGLYLDDFLKMGKKNDKNEVMKLQTFLNDYLKLSPKLSVNGIFGLQTYKAVLKFQEQESEYVLKPWVGVTLKKSKATGWVYKTTVTRINNIMCPELNLQNPPLTID